MKGYSNREVPVKIEFSRREFCALSAAVSAIALAGRLPLVAKDSAGNQKTLPYAVVDYARAIEGLRPPAERAGASYLYRRQNWPTTGGKGPSTLRLTPKADTLVLTQVLVHAAGKSTMSLSIQGNDRRGMKSWTMKNVIDNPEKYPVEAFGLEESGIVTPEAIEVNRGSYTERFPHQHPVFSLWQLFGLIPKLEAETKSVHLDLWDDGILLLPALTLRFDGELQLPVGDRQIAFRSYALYGTGLHAVHYLYQGDFPMPYVVTALMRIYSLEEIA